MTAFEPRQFRDACGQFGTGVTVIAAHFENGDHGMTANAFMSVSLEPPLIAVSIAERARLLPKLLAARRFTVSVLTENMEDVAWHFAGKYKTSLTNLFEQYDDLPVVKGAAASFIADLEQHVAAGDHRICIGRVRSIRSRPGARPLLFLHGEFTRASHGQAHIAPPALLEGVDDFLW